jgi:hypothetical protein
VSARATGFAVTAAILGALVLPGAAAQAEPTTPAPTIRFKWVEHSPHAYGWLPMTFRIRSVTIDRRGWSVRALIVNRSRQRISIRTQNRSATLWRHQYFAVWGPGPQCEDGPYERCGYTRHEATRFGPRPYGVTLRPGEAWSGTFGGPQRLRRRVRYYLSFGVFVPERGDAFSWLTQRSFRFR